MQRFQVMKSTIDGKTLRWTFEDGPTAGKTFEHTFGTDGTVTWRMIGDGRPAKPNQSAEAKAPPKPTPYQASQLSFDVFVVTYLSEDSGYTLTTVLDFKTGKVVAVASNEQQVALQHGSFEAVVSKAA